MFILCESFDFNPFIMAPVDSSPVPRVGSFELICSLKVNNLIPVHKYKSGSTGLTVVIAEVDGPVVNGHFCLATEAYDDDGLPHTLEHLIFLGSERYPFKGVLDLLANRCLASGTNAWTDTDHTCYTMTTAGSEGFLSLMPIYLDHILYPTLTESGFTTEVHHVTGEGEDAGVVYCEMQGRENTGESLTHLAALRAVYPGKCGYKSETGGVLSNLRESTDNAKVRAYHKEFYRPENLTLIITGQVKASDVFAALAVVEQTILAKGDRGPFVRPWQGAVPPLESSHDIEVLYPCDDEDNGLVVVAWRGPSAVDQLDQLVACSVLLKYLTDTTVSPLPQHFVEVDDPYASKVNYNLCENRETVLYLVFEGVPVDKLDLLDTAVASFLSGLDHLDMPRLRSVIHRHVLETLSHLENNPHESVAYMLIGDMLYGNTEKDLDQRLNAVQDLRRLDSEPESFWLALLHRYLTSKPRVTVRGKPSVTTQKRMAQDESDRVSQQVAQLGAQGLADKARELLAAMQQNEQPPPPDMLTSVPIPGMDSINFHPVTSFTTESSEQHENFNCADVPVYMHLDHIRTNFVYMFVLLDTAKVPRGLRRYLPLLLEALLELPVQRGEELVPYEQIVAELETDTVAVSTRIGLEATSRFSCGPYAHTAALMLQLEPSKYERCIVWVRELLYQTRLTTERLRIIAAKGINDVSQSKRKGNKVVADLMKGLRYSADSNHFNSSMLRQHKFLLSVVEQLDSAQGSAQVLSDLEEVRRVLTDPRHMALHLAADVEALAGRWDQPAQLWAQMLPAGQPTARTRLNVTQDWKLLNNSCACPGQKEPQEPQIDAPGSCLVGLGCVESSFFSQTTPCISDFNHPDLPPLLVFLQYLTQLEGPMWRQIRGQGLAYSYNIVPRPNEGLLYLSFYRATNCVAAYKEARRIVEAQLQEAAVWEQALFESARCSLIFEFIDKEKSVGDAVSQSMLSYFKGVDLKFNRKIVQLISKVTLDDLKRVGPLYVRPLFDPARSLTSLVCHPTKVEEISAGFQEMNCNLKMYPSLEDSFLGQW